MDSDLKNLSVSLKIEKFVGNIKIVRRLGNMRAENPLGGKGYLLRIHPLRFYDRCPQSSCVQKLKNNLEKERHHVPLRIFSIFILLEI